VFDIFTNERRPMSNAVLHARPRPPDYRVFSAVYGLNKHRIQFVGRDYSKVMDCAIWGVGELRRVTKPLEIVNREL
jgi:hypothetical protein